MKKRIAVKRDLPEAMRDVSVHVKTHDGVSGRVTRVSQEVPCPQYGAGPKFLGPNMALDQSLDNLWSPCNAPPP